MTCWYYGKGKEVDSLELRVKAREFLSKNAVLCIAVVLAVLTSIIVKPDGQYIEYFDFRTLTCLFCTLAVVCALRNIHFFTVVAERIVSVFRRTRYAIIALVYITFIGSMLIANDMALITFLPLGYIVLKSTGNEEYMSFAFIMQNIAANLGGMLTPFGNPQNLYLYSYFNISNAEFIQIMAMPFVISIVIITACCFKIPNNRMEVKTSSDYKLSKWRTTVYLMLFAFSILIVFRTIPYWTGLIVIPVSLLVLDRKALKDVDYGLLLTFCAFFVFAGNMSRIGVVKDILSYVINKNTLLFGTLSCQLISNVPSAILLSKFTQNYQQLLVAVNIGGAGTLIASLASLITFREYCKNYPDKKSEYLKEFSIYNFSIMVTLLVIMMLKYRI